VPIINVSFEEFEDMPAQDNYEREAMFKRFVNRFLMLRNSVGVDEFRLQYCVPCGTDDVGVPPPTRTCGSSMCCSGTLGTSRLSIRRLSWISFRQCSAQAS
jgi:hypothetical protein